MSIQSGRFDVSQIQTLNGKPYPDSDFAKFVHSESHHHLGHRQPENIDVILSTGMTPAIINKMVLFGQSPEDLWYNLEQSINHVSSPSPFQRGAIQYFHEVKDHYLNNESKTSLETEKMFRSFYSAFDDIFFFNSLRGLCKINICPPGSMGTAVAVTYHPGKTSIPDGYVCLIAIHDTSEQYPKADREFRLRDYLETLLHEMLHAYFSIYTCECSALCRRRQDRILGITGHGMAWMWTALEIEEVTEPLLGVRLDMAMREFVFEETSYKNAVPASVKGRWGVDVREPCKSRCWTEWARRLTR